MTFVDGPMGMGIDPPHNAPVGSVVTVVVDGGQADKSGKIRVGDSVISINAAKRCCSIMFISLPVSILPPMLRVPIDSITSGDFI